MKVPTRELRVVIFALLGVGLVSAVVLGRGREKRTATIPAGTALVAALEREVSTERSRVGDMMIRTVMPRLRDQSSQAAIKARPRPAPRADASTNSSAMKP